MAIISLEVFDDEIEANERLSNPVQLGCFLIKRMQQKGIPVTGTIWPEGVAFGRITFYYDDMLGARVYEWQQD
jgi:hypothetical protein